MAKRTCTIEGCDNRHKARGLCGTHYARWRQHGSVADPPSTRLERFWSKVDMSDRDGCWRWTGARVEGYGQFHGGSRVGMAHRFAYETLVGPVPEGLELDHLCRNRACVNPDHLEPVTHRENVRRGESVVAANARADECVNGHPFDLLNTYWRPNGWRQCRMCAREHKRKWRATHIPSDATP